MDTSNYFEKVYDRDASGDVPKENANFFLHDSAHRVGVLIVHGFMADPKESKELAGLLHQELKVDVIGLRLPGHGTSPEDLLLTTRHDWQLAVQEAHAFMKTQYKKTIIIGVSMGALLSMQVAVETPPDALVMVGVPLHLSDSRIERVATICRFLPFVKRWIASKAVPTTPDLDRLGFIYEQIYVGAVLELTQVIAEKRPLLKDLSCPLLLCHSESDPVADVRAVRTVMAETTDIMDEDKASVVGEGPHSLFYKLALTPPSILDALREFIKVHSEDS